jgi:hypothetical protein
VVRLVLVSTLSVTIACSSKPPAPKTETVAPPVAVVDAAPIDAPEPELPGTTSYATLAEAMTATIPADARVIGIGELHSRVDRAQVRSSLSQFTAALPSFGANVSDLILETFITDPKCGQQAQQTTQKMETEVKRPVETKSEIAQLADAAKAAGIQPHAMTVTCADYKSLAPSGQVDPLAMLTLTTRELKRIAASAVAHRDKDPQHRPWIMLYGGALHNDRFPEDAVKEWSYAAAIDQVTQNHFVELDVIVPELAADDAQSQKQPWFPLVEQAGSRVRVFTRGERSFVIVLPKAAPAAAQ